MAKTESNQTMDEQQQSNPWQEMVEVMIPAKSRSEQPTEYYNINGHKYFVPKGVMTRVPRPVYELMQNQFDAERDLRSNARELFAGERMPRELQERGL